MHELGRLAEQLPARHVLFLVDCCYSLLGRRAGPNPRPDLQALIENRSRMVITAGTEQQAAIEDSSLQHGIFTHFLFRIPKNREPQSASELFVALRMSVAQRTQNRMLPQLREIVVGSGEFVFFAGGFSPAQRSAEIERLNARLSSASAKATRLEDVVRTSEAADYRYMVLAPEGQLLRQGAGCGTRCPPSLDVRRRAPCAERRLIRAENPSCCLQRRQASPRN